jgi:BASS family bile acid:Na+ symporter
MSHAAGLVLKVVLLVAIALAAFTTGLGAPKPGPQSIWRHPGQLVRALLAILVAVPLWAFAFLEIVPLSPVARSGIFVAVLAIGIGPVAGLKRLQGDSPAVRRAFELNVVTLLISIVYVPFMVALLAWLLKRNLSLNMVAVAKIVLIRALIPLGLGIVVARYSPHEAARLRRPLTVGVDVVIALLLVMIIAVAWRQLASIGLGGLLAALVVAAGAVVIGHFLGGPTDETRAPLAAASAMRFPALGLLLAQITPLGDRLVPAVLVYVVAALIAVSVYGRVTQRHGRGTTGPARRPTAPAPA